MRIWAEQIMSFVIAKFRQLINALSAGGNMSDEDDVKACRNTRCKRKGVLVIRPNSKYCSSCGAKLKLEWGTRTSDGDQPPIIDVAPDVPNRRPPTNGQALTIVGAPPKQMVLPGEKKLEYFEFKEVYDKELGRESHTGEAWTTYLEYKEDYYTRHQATPAAATKAKKGSDTFSCAADLEGCPLQPKKNDRLIRLPYEMFNLWVWLALRNDTEWIAYLKGAKDEATGVWTISDMYFPKQRANGAHVDAEDGEIQEGTIGSVHSHVNMGAFFSVEDKNHWNHPVEMVVNRKGDLAAVVRVQLQCGKFSRVETTALLVGGPDMVSQEDVLAAKLTEEKVITAVTITAH
jgi:hypothetical protein